jgi:hypothetical protein
MTKMMEEIVQLCSETTECIRGFAEHRAATNARMRRAQQNREEEKKDRVVQQRRMMQMEGVIVSEKEEIKEPAAGEQHIIEAPTPPANVDYDPEVIFKAAYVAPIVDRMGRMLIDFALLLNNLVKMHH